MAQPPLQGLSRNVTDPHARRRSALVAAGLTALFGVVTALVVARYSPLVAFDSDVVTSWSGAVQDTPWRLFFVVVAAGSQPWVVRALMLLLVAVFVFRREVLTAAWILSVVVVNAVAWGLLKVVVQRPRPDWLHQIAGWSFPSGHAAEIAASMGVLIVLASRLRRSSVRRACVAVALVVVALVGCDRVFLAAHNPSDVVGGWLLGAAVVFGALAVFGLPTVSDGPVSANLAVPAPAERPRTLAVVLNPIKVVDANVFKARVGRAARAAGWDEPLWFETTVDDAGGSMARAAVAAGADVVVAAGGDGTVRVVCSEMAASGVPVGVIPTGTGNLLARNLGIPLLLESAVDTVLRGQDRAVDVVRLEGDGLASTRFVVMAGLGLDAAIMDGVPDALKARLGWPAYLIAGARQLRYPAVRVDISVDGADPVRRRVRTVLVGNVGSLQAGIPLLPDARIDDGVLDVVVIAPRQLFGWVSLAWRVFTKHPRTDDRLDRFTGRRVVVKAAHPTPRQLDGDTVGAGTELRAEIEPGVLLVRVPR
jgi:diacylglycerol kinase family enzyme/membrane-associated phospholipid phosphatase